MQPASDPDSRLSRAFAKFCIWVVIVVGLLSLVALGWGIATQPSHPHATVQTHDGNSDCGVFGGCP